MFRRIVYGKKDVPEIKEPESQTPFSKIPEHKDILAIAEGRFAKPVKGSGRFINANYPPDDATKEELEVIKRFWGDPEDAAPLREMNIKSFKKSERKHKFEPSFV